MRFYKVQLDNGKFGIVDLKARWKIVDDNGSQMYTSFIRGCGFTEDQAQEEVNRLNK